MARRWDGAPPRKLVRLEDEDAFDEDGASTTVTSTAAGADDDEEDELEAFMRENAVEVKKADVAPPKLPVKGVRDDIEVEDEMESYVNMLQARGVEIGAAAAAAGNEDEAVNSDEEVYAAARLADAGNDEDESTPIRKDIEPLAPVDHSVNDYIEINKNFYEEHPDIAVLTAEQVGQLRRQLDMRVYGPNVPKPCFSFAHFGFDDALIKTISAHGYTEPTSIQKQAIPVAMSGRDIIGVAKTGSGKTAAYLLPMIVHLMDQPELEKGDGPIGIVLAPTRELCLQIYQEAKKFAKAYGLKVVCIYGGTSKLDQFKELRGHQPPEIIVATPGRFIDMIKMKATNFKRASFCVLDEADRMFDLGFEPQVRSIVTSIRPDRQTLMFSATFNKKVEHLCRDILLDPVRINIGNVGEANSDITQLAVVMNSDAEKWPWLMSHLASLLIEGQLIIFVSRIGAVDELASLLNEMDYECVALHGELTQGEREKVMRDFKKGRKLILVATDIAARGLDIPDVKTVINFDNPRDIDSHVHRIGRTGRAGQKGTAYTFITQKEEKFAADLVRNFEGAGQIVPPELMDLAMRYGKFRSNRAGLGSYGGGGRGGRHGGGGGRGGKGRGINRAGIGSSGGVQGSDSKGPIRFQAATTDARPTATAPSSGPVRFAPSSQPYSTVPSSQSGFRDGPPSLRFTKSSEPYSSMGQQPTHPPPQQQQPTSSSSTPALNSSSSSSTATRRSRWQ